MKSRAFSWEIHDLVGQFIAAFDDVVIGRFNRNREEKDRIEVAYVYQPKARVLHDIENRAQNLKLPIASVVIDSVSRNNNRAFNKIEGFTYPARIQDRFSKITVKIPPVVPVDIKVKLSLLATYQTDIDQLISNFAAYANPYIIISWKVPEEFGLPASMPLNSKVEWDGNISLSYPVDINHSARSVITADASFTIEGWLFKDIVDPINNIFFIDANFYNTRILSAGNFVTYDDYATLSGADYSYSEGQIKITEVDTVSISGSPTITNVFYTPRASDRGSFPLIDTNYTTNSAEGNIVLYGKRFNYTRNVYISSNNPNLYSSLTGVSFTYYPSFTAAPIPASNYRVITDNIMEITMPALTSVGKYTFIVDTVVGWDSTFSGMSGYFIRPGYSYAGVNCESNNVTIYTNNNTFSASSIAYLDSELSRRYTGYFIINNNTYSYTSGVGTLSSCPVYAYPGTICNGDNVTIFTRNSSFRVNSTAYTDRGVSATYTGYFLSGGSTYSYINGVGSLSACPYAFNGTICNGTATTIFTYESAFNVNSRAYSTIAATSPYTGFFIRGDNTYYYSNGSGTLSSCPILSYSHQGQDCNGSNVTIYTNNASFSHTNTAYTDSGLTAQYTGYFVKDGTNYYYSGGSGTQNVTCAYSHQGQDCNGANVTIYTNNSNYFYTDAAYTDLGLTSPYTGFFVKDGTNYYYSGGSGTQNVTCAYSHQGQDCNSANVTIYTNNASFNYSDTAYTNPQLTSPYTGFFIINYTTYYYSGGSNSANQGCSWPYTGMECNGTTPVTIYITSNTFNTNSIAYTDAGLSQSYTGFFVYQGSTYYYSGGSGQPSSCPTQSYSHQGQDCNGANVTIYTNNSNYFYTDAAYTDLGLTSPYTGFFIINNTTHYYSGGSGSANVTCSYSYTGTECDGSTPVTIYINSNTFNINATAYTDAGTSQSYTGFFVYQGSTYHYSGGSGNTTTCP